MKEYKVTVDKEGTIRWYNEKGQLHREGGPAIECSNGHKFWYKEGQFHREDGAAVEHENGDRYWYKNGKFHREGGPAIERVNGFKEWWLNGEYLTEEEHGKRTSSCDGKEILIEGKTYILKLK